MTQPTIRALREAALNNKDTRHKLIDPRTSCSVSLPESLWAWIEDHAAEGKNGLNRSAVMEAAVRAFMEVA